jgi:glycosyltransferase involved in cell wall biosynthesis
MPESMRVGLYVDSPEIGGAEVFARQLLRELSSTIHVTVVGTNQYVIEEVASQRDGVTTCLVPQVRGRLDISTIRMHAQRIRELELHLLHINHGHLWSGQYGVIAAAWAGVPRIGTVHGVFPARNRSQRLLTITIARVMQQFVGVCDYVTNTLVRELHIPPDRVRTIYCGVPTPASPNSTPPDPDLIAAVGRFAPEKGFDLLLEAVERVPQCRLVLIGDGLELEHLIDQAARLGIKHRVTFAGWLDGSWVNQFKPSLLVVPSRREAAPLVIMEAMQAGIPVVATDVGGISELVSHDETGLLVEVANVRELAEAITSLLTDPQRREQMGRRAARRAASDFAAEKTARQYEHLYCEVADWSAKRASFKSFGIHGEEASA